MGFSWGLWRLDPSFPKKSIFCSYFLLISDLWSILFAHLFCTIIFWWKLMKNFVKIWFFHNLKKNTKNIFKTRISFLQASLETVKCEELQLELSAALKSRTSRQPVGSISSSVMNSSVLTGTTVTSMSSGGSSLLPSSSVLPPTSACSTVTWAPTITQDQGSEIDIIMAKIEQARLSIANVCVISWNSLLCIETSLLYTFKTQQRDKLTTFSLWLPVFPSVNLSEIFFPKWATQSQNLMKYYKYISRSQLNKHEKYKIFQSTVSKFHFYEYNHDYTNCHVNIITIVAI